MKIQRKHIIIAILLLLVVIAIYFYIRSKKKNELESIETNIPSGTNFPLKYGSKGPEVGQLQKYLFKEFGEKTWNTPEIDNDWGPLVDASVKKNLQRDNISSSFYYKLKMDKY